MRELASSIWSRLTRPATAAMGSHLIATSIRRAPVSWLVLCGGFLVAAIVIGTVVMVGEFRERALRTTERELENTVLLLTRHFDRQFDDAAPIPNNLVSQMQISGMASPEIFASRMSSPEAHLMLQAKVSVLANVGDVQIFDSEGKLINSSGALPLPIVNIAERAYFKTFKSNPQSTVIAEPVRSYFSGNWITVIAHRLNGPDGVFLGVMTRRVDPAYYENFFASIALGKDASIAMV